MTEPRNSLVVPVYRNAAMISALVDAVDGIAAEVAEGLEAIYVVDGSPDDSRVRLLDALVGARTPSRVVQHSRNFGSFSAIRTGMRLARGRCIAVMAADLQEPPELVIEALARIGAGATDIVAGERLSRDDRGDAASGLYWSLYRRFVMHEIPPGGVDVFACTDRVRDVVCSMEDVHTSLVAQLFWVGFRRETIGYDRRPRPGESGWTTRRKLRYLSDSVFAFSDLPVRVLWAAGLLGLVIGVVVGLVVLFARVAGLVAVPGYAATVLILLVFLSLNSVGLGIIGSYVWRTYETAKGRPGGIVQDVVEVRDGRRL